MSQINPVSTSSAAVISPRSLATASGRITSNTSSTSHGSDRVEVSDAARLLSRLSDLPDVREGLVSRVQGEIATGSYDTDDKVDAALDSLLEDLG